MVVGGGVNFQDSRDKELGPGNTGQLFFRQGKMVIALSEPGKLLG